MAWMGSMKRKIPFVTHFGAVLQFVLVCLFLPFSLHGQEIHITVLDGRNGKAMTSDCVNVWIGSSGDPTLVAPTNNDGTAVLHFRDDQVAADAVSTRACRNVAVTGPQPFPRDADTISVASSSYVTCQEYGKLTPEQPAASNILKQIRPSYSIEKILASGISAANTCGKVRREPKPGQVILFVRPLTWREKLSL
jgi:hypothetical protein